MKFLAKTFAESLIKKLNQGIRCLLDKLFPQFGISLDVTPSFAEAECLMAKFVTMDYEIIELTAKLSLFKKALNSIQLSNHIVKTITETL